MDTYGRQCGSCIHLETEVYSGSKNNCHCSERGGFHKLNESCCYKYEYAEYRDYYDLNRRWYIVTEICKRLGLTQECAYVSKLFSFREDVLDNDPKYEDFLKDYDVLGPFLANLIENDGDSFEVCKNLFRLYLSKVSCLIIDKNYDEALDTYIKMIKILKSIYGIETEKQNASILIKVRS